MSKNVQKKLKITCQIHNSSRLFNKSKNKLKLSYQYKNEAQEK